MQLVLNFLVLAVAGANTAKNDEDTLTEDQILGAGDSSESTEASLGIEEGEDKSIEFGATHAAILAILAVCALCMFYIQHRLDEASRQLAEERRPLSPSKDRSTDWVKRSMRGRQRSSKSSAGEQRVSYSHSFLARTQDSNTIKKIQQMRRIRQLSSGSNSVIVWKDAADSSPISETIDSSRGSVVHMSLKDPTPQGHPIALASIAEVSSRREYDSNTMRGGIYSCSPLPAPAYGRHLTLDSVEEGDLTLTSGLGETTGLEETGNECDDSDTLLQENITIHSSGLGAQLLSPRTALEMRAKSPRDEMVMVMSPLDTRKEIIV